MKIGGIYKYLGRGTRGIYATNLSRQCFRSTAPNSNMSRGGEHRPEDRFGGFDYFEEVTPPSWVRLRDPLPGNTDIIYMDGSGRLRINDVTGAVWKMRSLSQPKPVLPDPIEIGDGSRRAEFAANGDIRVGCTLIPFEKLREIFVSADDARRENI